MTNTLWVLSLFIDQLQDSKYFLESVPAKVFLLGQVSFLTSQKWYYMKNSSLITACKPEF